MAGAERLHDATGLMGLTLQERFGTNDELYRLLRGKRPQKVALGSLSPIMTADFAAEHHHSKTRRPILVRCDGTVTDGNHRYFEALKAGRKTIDAYVITTRVLEDVRTGRAVALAGKCHGF